MDNIPLSEWSGSGATKELHETIKQQIVSTNRQSVVLMRLTWAAVFLGVVQAVGTVAQIVIAFR